MDYAKESLRLHGEWGGKIEVICKVPCATKDALSLAYTPASLLPAWRSRRTMICPMT